MLIGAGKMSELAARHLVRGGASSLIISNRNFERATEMAAKLDGKAVRFEDLLETLPQADIVISSTGAPNFVLKKEDGSKILARRRIRPMFFIDIAVPRDIDPEMNKLDNIFVYDIDDLQEVINANLNERTREAQLGEEIVEHEVERFLERIKTLEVVPTIVSHTPLDCFVNVAAWPRFEMSPALSRTASALGAAIRNATRRSAMTSGDLNCGPCCPRKRAAAFVD